VSRDCEPSSAFYCVADSRYFLGAVGLINSLRLHRHTEPIYLLDCGLTEAQRALLAEEAELVHDESDTPPWLLKTIAPLRHPAEVMILIDCDMIVTRGLGPLFERARQRKVVAVENDRDHFCWEWRELLELGPLRRIPYVSSGLVAFEREHGERVLSLMERLQGRIDFDRSFWRRNESDYPFLYGDQDVLNAILAAEGVLPADGLEALPHRSAPTPPFKRLRVRDQGALWCAYPDGFEPYALHNFFRKPWLVPMRSSPYSRLLTRCLTGDDVPLAPQPEAVPLWLRRGAYASAARLVVDIGIGAPAYVSGKLGSRPVARSGWADARWSEGRGR
jgi:hypothetical protein